MKQFSFRELAKTCGHCLLGIMTIGLFCHCSGNSATLDSKTRSRHIARAAQGMSASAKLGSLCTVDATYTEREPNPNAYVGKQIYRRYCESCHGNGRKAPNILENRVTASDPESDYYIILYGLTEMPAFRTRLTRFQVYDVLKYMDPEFTEINQLESASPSP